MSNIEYVAHQTLRTVAALCAGFAINVALKTEEPLAWVIFSLLVFALVFDLAVKIHKLPKRKPFTVMLKSSKTQQTEVHHVLAYHRVDAMDVALRKTQEPWMTVVSIEETKSRGPAV